MELDMDKKEKNISVEILLEQLGAVEDVQAKDLKKIADVFGRIQEIKSISFDDIEKLFICAKEKAQGEFWKVILEIYSRFYNRNKVKVSSAVISLIKTEIKERLSKIIDVEVLEHAIREIDSDNELRLITEIVSLVKEKVKESNAENLIAPEVISYLYVYCLIEIKSCYVSDYLEKATKVERCLFSAFACEDKNDPLFVKSVRRAIVEDRYAEKFMEMTHLYGGVLEEITQLYAINQKRAEIIGNNAEEINMLKNKIDLLQQNIEEKAQYIQECEEQISELKTDMHKADNRNEYNENLYKQQFLALKKSLIDKIKNDLKLEIDGIENIAENLSDVQRERIQRRLVRISKVLQKAGE